MASFSSGSAVRLGKDINFGQPVTLEQKQRQGGTYVIGKTRSGKTTLLVNMILQDIEQGLGVCFLDPHGDAISDILSRIPEDRVKDVILLDPFDEAYAFGLNLMQCDNPNNQKQVSRTISYIMQVFAKLFTDSGDLLKDAPNMAETLQNALPVLLAYNHPKMTLAELPLLTMDENARTRILATFTTNAYVKSFWDAFNSWRLDRQEELTGSTRRRIGNFLILPYILQIIGQSETTINFRNIMDEGKILLVKLSAEIEQITDLLGSVIIGQLLTAAYSRADIPFESRRQFNLYADEYQRFATPDFKSLLTEAGKFGIATIIAHQTRSQLDKDNRGATLNAANLVIYQVIGEDAEELAKQFDTTPPPGEPRREAIQVIAQKPVEHILRFGHKHKDIQAFHKSYLRPLSNHIETLTPDSFLLVDVEKQGLATHMYENMWEYKVKPSRLKAGLQEINSFFVRMMEHSLSSDAIDEQIAEIIVLLRAFLSFAPDEEIRVVKDENYGYGRREGRQSEWYEVKLDDRTKWALMLLLKKLTAFHKIMLTKEEDATFQESLGTDNPYEYQDYLTGEDNYLCKELVAARYEFAYSQLRENVAIPPYKLSEEVCERLLAALEQERQRVRAELDREPYSMIYFKDRDGFYTSVMILTEKEQEDLMFHNFLEFHLFSIISVDDLPEDWRNIPIVLQSGYVLNMLPRYKEHSRYYPREKIHEQLLLRAKYEVSHVLAFILSLRNAGVALSQNPILLDTGEYKEVPGVQLSSDEMENRIANELANPKQKYTARVNLANGKEHTIAIEQTEQFRPAAAPSDILSRTQRIIEQTRQYYCKSRSEVDAEIAARQAELTKRIEKKAQIVREEREAAPAGTPTMSEEQREQRKKLMDKKNT